MASNTLTNLIPDLYNAADVVSRELVGFIPSVAMNATGDGAAVGETIRIPVTPANTAAFDITPGATPADSGGQTIGNATLTISKARAVPVSWNGEQQMGFGNTGMYSSVASQQFAQAMRVLCNELETDIGALYTGSCRAYGTAGTVPFSTSFADIPQLAKILDDNGAPADSRTLVFSTAARANMSNLLKGNFTGGGNTDSLRGVLYTQDGFDFRASAKIARRATVGTGANYVIDGTGSLTAGTVNVKVKTGSGTILAGDVITIAHASGSQKYVVTTGIAAAGTLTIAAPGLMDAVVDGQTVTVNSAFSAGMFFSRNAIQLAVRAPKMPDGGDSADDVMTIIDPVSGLPFQIAMYRQYRQIRYEVGLAWGVSVIKPEHLGIHLS